ncbi:hypothetical protein IU479_27315 [Nocardia abscessus]|uniref:hypothetical protein n=1 Tax=Nocardia abscessus TaxID=120957 RepID=UPI001893D371|nr:hypothetical protein [Nocardia abscessus]MBF6221809.1 hypothetical protein [Nocardia abscessus]
MTPLPITHAGTIDPHGTARAIDHQLPQNDTMVLFDRQLRPDVDTATMSRFGDDRWHLNEAIFEAAAAASSLNFTAIPAPLRNTAKHYVWHLINTDCPMALNRASVGRYSLRTIASSWASLKDFFDWLHRREIRDLGQVSRKILDDYLTDLSRTDASLRYKHKRINEVRRLWSYRVVLPEQMTLPAPFPWGDDRGYEMFGKTVPAAENTTPRIAEKTMHSLLEWAMRFIEDFFF